MKNNKGITLAVLAITVVILFILVGVGISQTYLGVSESKVRKEKVELGIVRQAIAEQYIKAASLNGLNKPISEETSNFWKGTRVESFSGKLPEKSSLNIDSDEQDEIDEFYTITSSYDVSNYDYQEELYYELLPNDLKEMGITDAKDTYIVNYQTKEVYNSTLKVNNENKLLYLPGDR